MKAPTKAERAEQYARFGGRCGYCGIKLGPRWHIDHIEPVGRLGKWVKQAPGRPYKWVATGELNNPENDRPDNRMPSCHSCNIDKSNLRLADWRARLEDLASNLERNYSAYRHAKRFGIVTQRISKVVFFFECNRRRIINHY